MWLICFIFLLIALIPLYIAKEKNTWKSNKEFQQKDMKLRHYSSGIAPDAPGGILRNYVEEFRYANELYKKLWAEFQEAHPIGSIFDYTDMDGEQSMLITSKKDQLEALDKAYIFSALSGVYNNGVEQYCLGEARKHIVELGYAPDNVKERIFPGYNVHKIGSQPTNYSFGGKNVETRYDSWFVFTTGYGGWSALMDRRDPRMSSQYKERRRYLCGIMSYDGDTDSRYTKLFLEELKRYEDEENAVIRMQRTISKEAQGSRPVRCRHAGPDRFSHVDSVFRLVDFRLLVMGSLRHLLGFASHACPDCFMGRSKAPLLKYTEEEFV